LTIATVLVGSIASAMVMALQALPDAKGESETILDTRAGISDMLAELSYAIAFTEISSTAIEAVVPDRNGDGSPELVRYAWSSSGNPLTRAENGATAKSMVDDVRLLTFDMSYETSAAWPDDDSPEILLAKFDGWPGAAPTLTRDAISSTRRVAFTFTPGNKPADTLFIRITRVVVGLRGGNANTDKKVLAGLSYVTSGRPSGELIGSWGVLNASYASTTTDMWRELRFVDAVATPGRAVALTIYAEAANVIEVRKYTNGMAPANGTTALVSTDSGVGWSNLGTPADSVDIPFYVYGTVKTLASSTASLSRKFAHELKVTVRVAADGEAPFRSATRLVNRPEVVP
ncbi:MAG: hypothetical protein KDA32_14445, partial [Phycisphaerales bacterium]|nr:hypothetical protein [Phycisphaerales bacterium]